MSIIETVPMDFWKTLGQYVYAYIDENNNWLYIGKGNGNRASNHIKTKGYDLNDLYIVAKNLESFNVDEKQDWQSFILESFMIARLNPSDNSVSGHYKECFEMAKFSDLFNVYKESQHDNFEALPVWYLNNYEKLKGRINVLAIKSDSIFVECSTMEQMQPSFYVDGNGNPKKVQVAIWANEQKLDMRKNQLYTFLQSCDVNEDQIEKIGSREIYEIKKELTIDEVIDLFDQFFS